GETIQQYARRHMAKEHHIDDFDLQSFHQLHDLDRNGFWDRAEIEAVYGVHHVYSIKQSKVLLSTRKKADHITAQVLLLLDADKDGRVSVAEFEKVGLDGLPNFADMGAEGHHYDEESEDFHSTPETQTDESYNHPEDIEHFASHESIERKEAEKEAAYIGITVEEALAAHDQAEKVYEQRMAEVVQESADEVQQPLEGVAHPHAEQVEQVSPPVDAPNPKITRITPPEKQDPAVKFRDAKAQAEAKGDWGLGSEGYSPPTDPGDKMRRNLPYKYKFKRNWGDF
ncbi:hypothetical protein BDP27DRAFT_1244538, partial [Rhodocollybia butyracea]